MSDVDKSEHGSRDSLSTSVDEDSEHGVGLLTGQQRLFSRPRSNLRGYLVYAAIAVLWILSLFSTARLSSKSCSKDGFAAGFDTDLGEPQRPSFNVSGPVLVLTLRDRAAAWGAGSRENQVHGELWVWRKRNSLSNIRAWKDPVRGRTQFWDRCCLGGSCWRSETSHDMNTV